MQKTHTARVVSFRARPPAPAGNRLPASIQQLITALANEEVQRHFQALANEPATNTHMRPPPAEGTLPPSGRRIRPCR